jgi:hypothetical protein
MVATQVDECPGSRVRLSFLKFTPESKVEGHIQLVIHP